MLKKFFGPLRKYEKIVEQITDIRKKVRDYSREEAQARTGAFKRHIAEGGSTDAILPEAFALVQCAAMNTIGQCHFDVQLIGGIAMHHGMVAEMNTGEGKTLTATLTAYLNALEGEGVHIVTLNNYLSRRDFRWMQPVYAYLGLTVGLVTSGMNNIQRKPNYATDITYGSYNEFCFDFLRDQTVIHPEDVVQRGHHFAIIDDIDAVLIDEGRTPMKISGPSYFYQDLYSPEIYLEIDAALRGLNREWRIKDNPPAEAVARTHDISPQEVGKFMDYYADDDAIIKGHFVFDEKTQDIRLTGDGLIKVAREISHLLKKPEMFENLSNISLYDEQDIEAYFQTSIEDRIVYFHVMNALKANYLYNRDEDYIVKDGNVVVVDEVTGRPLFDRRYSRGLHTAIEAHENLEVKIEPPALDLATITLQNYFTIYRKMAGMTGTAIDVKNELNSVYGLDVLEIPTNKPVIRKDYPDVIYKTKEEKYDAAIAEVEDRHRSGQPVLIGTTSIGISEFLSGELEKRNIPHTVLNAKHYEKEAHIVKNAGQKGAVTVSTNMAGRGTDIALGEGVAALGGLHIIGTERHEARRIDEQLRGRSGRQGDPGSSRFFLSLEDDLLRIFGGERIATIMEKLGMEDGEPIEHNMISKAIKRAQGKVESHNFNIRKKLLEYDDVLDDQREFVYRQRREILNSSDVSEFIETMIVDRSNAIATWFHSEESPDIDELNRSIFEHFRCPGNLDEKALAGVDVERLGRIIRDLAMRVLNQKVDEIGMDNFRELSKQVLLSQIDTFWVQHLANLEMLRMEIGLAHPAGGSPLELYRERAHNHYDEMVDDMKWGALDTLFHIEDLEHSDPFRSQSVLLVIDQVSSTTDDQAEVRINLKGCPNPWNISIAAVTFEYDPGIILTTVESPFFGNFPERELLSRSVPPAVGEKPGAPKQGLRTAINQSAGEAVICGYRFDTGAVANDNDDCVFTLYFRKGEGVPNRNFTIRIKPCDPDSIDIPSDHPGFNTLVDTADEERCNMLIGFSVDNPVLVDNEVDENGYSLHVKKGFVTFTVDEDDKQPIMVDWFRTGQSRTGYRIHAVDKAIRNHDLLSGRLRLLTTKDTDPYLIQSYKEKLDAIYADPHSQFETLLESSCPLPEIEIHIRILAMTVNAIDDGEDVLDYAGEIVDSFLQVLHEGYDIGNERVREDILVNFYLLSFFVQLRFFLRMDDHDDLLSSIQETVDEINDRFHSCTLNVIIDNLSRLTLYRTRKDKPFIQDTLNIAYMQDIEDLSDDVKNHTLLTLCMDLLEHAGFYKDLFALDPTGLTSILDDYFTRYLKEYEHDMPCNFDFMANAVSIFIMSKDHPPPVPLSRPLIEAVRSYLKWYFDAYLIQEVMYGQSYSPKGVFAEHLVDFLDIFSSKGWGKECFCIELAILLIDRSYREGINRIRHNQIFIESYEKVDSNQIFFYPHLKAIILSHILYFVEDSLNHKLDSDAVFNEAERIFSDLTFQHIDKISAFAVELYRNYFNTGDGAGKNTEFFKIACEEDKGVINFKSLSLELQFSIAIKLLVVYNRGWESFLGSVNDILAPMDKDVRNVFCGVFSDYVINTFEEFERIYYYEDHIPSSRLALLWHELFLLLNNTQVDIVSSDLMDDAKKNIVRIVKEIDRSYNRINNPFLLFQFLTYIDQDEYFSENNIVPGIRKKEISKKISSLIHNIYKDFPIYYWHPFDRFIIEKINRDHFLQDGQH